MQGIRSTRLAGVLVMGLGWGLGGAGMAGACAAGGPGSPDSCGTPRDTPADTSATQVEVPCMRYHIPLLGNPSSDAALRNKYIKAFGSACYMSDDDVPTFNCLYKRWQDACADAVRIAEVYGAPPYNKKYMCQPDGKGNYTRQVGSDAASQIQINYQAAPRQTPLTDVNGVPTAVDGPYRNLTDPAGVGPGDKFDLNSGVPNPDGGFFDQQEWVLQVNKNANDGGVRSDLAGFKWKCERKNEKCEVVIEDCVEPEFLPDPEDPGPTKPNVHHVVPMKDLRSCPWGTNSYKNAAVISAKLNGYFLNNDPPVEEVKQLNSAKAYTP